MRKKFYFIITTIIVVVSTSISNISCNRSHKSCNLNSRTFQPDIPESKISGNSVYDSIALKWRQDTCGCMWGRSYDIAMSLIKHYELQGKDTTQVYKVLGHPYEVSRDEEGFIILTYIVHGIQLEKCYLRQSLFLDFDSLDNLQYHSDGYLMALHD